MTYPVVLEVRSIYNIVVSLEICLQTVIFPLARFEETKDADSCKDAVENLWFDLMLTQTFQNVIVPVWSCSASGHNAPLQNFNTQCTAIWQKP